MLRTGFRAVAILGLIGCGAFALLVLGFGKPPAAVLELTQTMRVLDEHTQSQAVIALNGRTRPATCRDVWVGNLHISEVDVAGLRPIIAVRGRILDETAVRFALFQLAGCPLPLSKRIASALVNGSISSTADRPQDGGAVYVVRMVRPRIEVVVSRLTKLPVKLAMVGRLRATSLVSYKTVGREGGI